jgi:probable phosphoglycerate mutase
MMMWKPKSARSDPNVAECRAMIFLVRHGETTWNAAGRFQGAQDSALTARGEEQASQIGKKLAAKRVGVESPIVAAVSPLGRTRATADIIAGHVALTRINEPRLAEVSLGSWDGLSEGDIDAEFPEARAGTDAFNWFFRSPDGETFEAACARVDSWLASVRGAGPRLAISHGLIGRLIRGRYLGMPKEELLALPVPQGVVYVLEDGAIAEL